MLGFTEWLMLRVFSKVYLAHHQILRHTGTHHAWVTTSAFIPNPSPHRKFSHPDFQLADLRLVPLPTTYVGSSSTANMEKLPGRRAYYV